MTYSDLDLYEAFVAGQNALPGDQNPYSDEFQFPLWEMWEDGHDDTMIMIIEHMIVEGRL